MRNKIYDSDNGRTLDSVGIKRRCYHNGEFSGNFADEWFRYIDIALHCLFYIFAVGIILAVENAEPVCTDNISPLEIVHGSPFIDNGLFLVERDIRVG